MVDTPDLPGVCKNLSPKKMSHRRQPNLTSLKPSKKPFEKDMGKGEVLGQ